MQASTYQRIRELSRMTVKELRATYREVFGEPSRSHHKELLRKRIAWRLQALDEGELPERARRRAEQLANDADLRLRAPRKPGAAAEPARTAADHVAPSRDRRLPQPGTLLSRMYRGRDLVVEVLEEGFVFEERRYRSLSAIAREITGSHWNGFVFFVLK